MRKLISLFSLIILFGAQLSGQDFPNSLALLQYIQGVNQQKVPSIVYSDFSVIYYTEDNGPESGKQIFETGNAQYLIYDKKIGINAKVHVGDSLVIILKSERIFETRRIDIENLCLFRIHKQDPERTLIELKKLGIDVDIMDEAIRLGRPMWIIGADKKDTGTPQIWIDKERLSVKKIHFINLAQQNVEQMEWDDFIDLDGFYIPGSVEIRSDPEIFYRIKKRSISIPENLPEIALKLKEF